MIAVTDWLKYKCVIVLPLTLMMSCVGLQCEIVVFLDHIHFLLVFSSHVIAMVSPFHAVGNTKLIFILSGHVTRTI